MPIRDFAGEVAKLCPEDTPTPSEKWVYLQFLPKDSTKLSSLHHTGCFRLKFMIQVCMHTINTSFSAHSLSLSPSPSLSNSSSPPPLLLPVSLSLSPLPCPTLTFCVCLHLQASQF